MSVSMDTLNLKLQIRLNKLMYKNGYIEEDMFNEVDRMLCEDLTKQQRLDIISSNKMIENESVG